MSTKEEIESIFSGKAFKRPLFYSYPGGLRFELSEGGDSINKFLTALNKGLKVCADVFSESETLTACLRMRSDFKEFTQWDIRSQMETLGTPIPKEHSLWFDEVPPDDRFDEDEIQWWVTVAFESPTSLLQNYLWSAFALDTRVEPQVSTDIYLFNLEKKIMVWPYDDRGMDIVGPNHSFLKYLYLKYNSYLLDHDREEMERSFGPPPRINFLS